MSKLLEAYTELNEAKDHIRDLEVRLLMAETLNEHLEQSLRDLMQKLQQPTEEEEK